MVPVGSDQASCLPATLYQTARDREQYPHQQAKRSAEQHHELALRLYSFFRDYGRIRYSESVLLATTRQHSRPGFGFDQVEQRTAQLDDLGRLQLLGYVRDIALSLLECASPEGIVDERYEIVGPFRRENRIRPIHLYCDRASAIVLVDRDDAPLELLDGLPQRG